MREAWVDSPVYHAVTIVIHAIPSLAPPGVVGTGIDACIIVVAVSFLDSHPITVRISAACWRLYGLSGIRCIKGQSGERRIGINDDVPSSVVGIGAV